MRIGCKIRNERRALRMRIVTLTSLGLCTILGAVVLMNMEAPRGAAAARVDQSTYKTKGPDNRPLIQPGAIAVTARSPAPAKESSERTVLIAEENNNALSLKNLLVPVAGVTSRDLHDSFYDSRSEGRIHKALDIMAPRDTPVLATDDGTVLKLHQSNRGGISLYQSDSSGNYVYFYGHLMRYADGIAEGRPVKRGEVIAFVGDTGNAGAGNCHLHFGISRMTEAGRWSGGEPINPYPLLSGKPAPSPVGAGK